MKVTEAVDEAWITVLLFAFKLMVTAAFSLLNTTVPVSGIVNSMAALFGVFTSF